MGQEIEFQAVEFGTRNQPDIGFPAGERSGALGRKVKLETEKAPLRAMQKAPNEGPGIEITDGRDAQILV